MNSLIMSQIFGCSKCHQQNFLHWQEIWPCRFNNASADTFQHFFLEAQIGAHQVFRLMEIADSQETHQEYWKINFTHPPLCILIILPSPPAGGNHFFFGGGAQKPGNGKASQDSFSTWQSVWSSALGHISHKCLNSYGGRMGLMCQNVTQLVCAPTEVHLKWSSKRINYSICDFLSCSYCPIHI